jgi:hypothetical protein
MASAFVLALSKDLRHLVALLIWISYILPKVYPTTLPLPYYYLTTTLPLPYYYLTTTLPLPYHYLTTFSGEIRVIKKKKGPSDHRKVPFSKKS